MTRPDSTASPEDPIVGQCLPIPTRHWQKPTRLRDDLDRESTALLLYLRPKLHDLFSVMRTMGKMIALVSTPSNISSFMPMVADGL